MYRTTGVCQVFVTGNDPATRAQPGCVGVECDGPLDHFLFGGGFRANSGHFDFARVQLNHGLRDTAQDFVIATGQTHPLSAFVSEAFANAGLDWRDHVDSNPALMRPTELRISRADPSLSKSVLGWQAQTTMAEAARLMVEAERERAASGTR